MENAWIKIAPIQSCSKELHKRQELTKLTFKQTKIAKNKRLFKKRKVSRLDLKLVFRLSHERIAIWQTVPKFGSRNREGSRPIGLQIQVNRIQA